MCRDWSSRRWRADAKKVGEAHHIVIAGDPEPDQEFVYQDGSVQFCAGGDSGAGDEVRLGGGVARVQGLARVAGGAVSLDG